MGSLVFPVASSILSALLHGHRCQTLFRNVCVCVWVFLLVLLLPLLGHALLHRDMSREEDLAQSAAMERPRSAVELPLAMQGLPALLLWIQPPRKGRGEPVLLGLALPTGGRGVTFQRTATKWTCAQLFPLLSARCLESPIDFCNKS